MARPSFVPVRAYWHEARIDRDGDQIPALKELKYDVGKLNYATFMELPMVAPKDPSDQDRILHVMNTLRRTQINSIGNLDKLKLKKTALTQDLLCSNKGVTALRHDREMRAS